MTAGDRAGLVNDAVTIAKYGHLDYATALNFISYMTNETHYVPWMSVSSQLFEIRDLLDSQAWKVSAAVPCNLLG